MAHLDIEYLFRNSELRVDVENTEAGYFKPTGITFFKGVASDVCIAPLGTSCNQEPWVHEENFHLSVFIDFDSSLGLGDDPLKYKDVGFFETTLPPDGDHIRYIDLLVYNVDSEDTPRVRRNAVVVSDGGGGS
jgi:hypothetical protein